MENLTRVKIMWTWCPTRNVMVALIAFVWFLANRRYDICCYNYEWTNGKCNECRVGTTTNVVAGRCASCKYNSFGYKCIEKCVCDQSQRCDPEVGCVPKTSITAMQTTYTGTTEPSLLQNETVTTKETPLIRNGTSIEEGIVLAICITSCFILNGVGYMIHKHRKRQSLKVRINNEEVILQPLEPYPYIGVYDEIDENSLSFDTTDLILTLPASHYETIDVFAHDTLSITTGTEHGVTGYLEPYFTIEEDGDPQSEDRISQKECILSNSSNSDVVAQDNTAYNNLYQPLQDNWQDGSHGYEVAVMVHRCIESSTVFDENTTSNPYYNVNQALQREFDMKSPSDEHQKSAETKSGHDKRLLGDDSSSVFKNGNLQDYINMNVESIISMGNCDAMESSKPFDQDKSKTVDQKSFSSDFDSKTESVNTCSNNICCFQDDNNSNSTSYEDAKSCI
ncbi:unnamed protein product [Mytilus coruscus]|uniref:MEGF10_11 n=1 Tax=Mytilus coruscus TaxID=42192 RepID=A0A6J8ASS4_MYTCO|nr:unnamed protein product [Mytilus coruscus]